MTTTTMAPGSAKEAARLLNNYARQYSAGAFATPTAKELERARGEGRWHWWPGVGAVSQRVRSPSWRADFTGRKYELHAGWHVITHIACQPGAQVPDLSQFARIYAYVEDTHLSAGLRAQGRELAAVKVSAASEIIGCWGRPGSGRTYPPAEAATLVRLDDLGMDLAACAAEVTALGGWTDRYPFYSDGSWGSLDLAGFHPEDPTWGIKPAEMSRAWWRDHPEEKTRTTCDWTVLARDCPATVAAVKGVSWWRRTERIRFLRMDGRGGKGGKLSRHTDVTDRAAGVQDGLIARFHIPLVTHPQITMSAWNLRGERTDAHLPPGSVWYLDARKPHAVTNPTGVDRLHLVVDVVADGQVRERIAAGQDMAT